ncbi:DUF1350 family protein [Gloeothece verrucosa]|uniref:DUF1350 domain-containing protein n=1 Tax=Gloeothece verrucosa (strain PCC 7822) TaxID=497965 RepID=E0UBK9_GLOV7|nr:DUF1350 family protein [Gloeothece verrucosa]ADN13953.1 protein of unknown function DUF1350 [Gloeothece verrucosa PCC 7822]
MKFRPISHSWVALHPKPQGVIQFIGGAFFGTFWPMIFYRSLLQSLFNDGYTIVLLPFNFTFNHYAESGFLIREQYDIMPELVRRAKFAGYDYQPYLSDQNFSWIGHSIGCKYIALLEAFSALPVIGKPSDPNYSNHLKELRKFIDTLIRSTAKKRDSQVKIARKIETTFTELLILINDLEIKRKEAKRLIEYYIKKEPNFKELKGDIEISSIFIKNQPSLLLAPVNTGLDSAIPQPLASIFINLGLNVKPTPEETYALIKNANLFNLLGLTSFKTDKIALSTCQWFEEDFKKPPTDFKEELKGGHLRPLGILFGNFVINFPDLKDYIPLIEPIQKRNKEFESPVSQLFQRLEDKQANAQQELTTRFS